MRTLPKTAVFGSPAQSPICGKYGQYVNAKCWYTASELVSMTSVWFSTSVYAAVYDSQPKLNRKTSMMNWNICIVVRCFFHCTPRGVEQDICATNNDTNATTDVPKSWPHPPLHNNNNLYKNHVREKQLATRTHTSNLHIATCTAKLRQITDHACIKQRSVQRAWHPTQNIYYPANFRLDLDKRQKGRRRMMEDV